jgi:hypothetical protein
MSTVKVNTVDKRTGSTLTLGGCGTTVTLGAGATQSGFGRTGTVDWCTTAKTSPFTGVSGKGYFVNTTCGAVTVTLPASPSAGDIISIADYASTFNTNNLIICNNSSKINGVCATAELSTKGQSITLVYVDATKGWKNTMDSTSNVTATPNYIAATGGTITTCGNYKIHTFTADGTFTICSAPTPANNNVDYLVIAGGAGGGFAGARGAGGGGAGGFRESYSVPVSGCYTASPLATPTSLPVSITSYPITVGAGGPAPLAPPYFGGCGSPSVFSTITSTGGGGGGGEPAPNNGLTGGSGGGGGATGSGTFPGGTGNTPPTSPPQGNPGGNGSANSLGDPSAGGGGGGAGVAGTNASPGSSGAGGNGSTTSISGTPTTYAGGGGGGGGNSFALGGSGGGGSGGAYLPPQGCVSAGTANTGGGGGGCANNGGGEAGGSGIVIIRYRYQ